MENQNTNPFEPVSMDPNKANMPGASAVPSSKKSFKIIAMILVILVVVGSASAYFIYTLRNSVEMPPSLEAVTGTGFIAGARDIGFSYEYSDIALIKAKEGDTTPRSNSSVYYYSESDISFYDVVMNMKVAESNLSKFKAQIVHYNTQEKSFYLFPAGVFKGAPGTKELKLKESLGRYDSNFDKYENLKNYIIPAYSPFIIFSSQDFSTFNETNSTNDTVQIKSIMETPSSYEYSIDSRIPGWHLSVMTREKAIEAARSCANKVSGVWIYNPKAENPDFPFGINPVSLDNLPTTLPSYLMWIYKSTSSEECEELQLEVNTGANGTDGSSSASTEEASTASATDESSTPSATDESSTPSATDESSTPSATDESSTPSATDESSTPSATDESSTPSASGTDGDGVVSEGDGPKVINVYAKPLRDEKDYYKLNDQIQILVEFDQEISIPKDKDISLILTTKSEGSPARPILLTETVVLDHIDDDNKTLVFIYTVSENADIEFLNYSRNELVLGESSFIKNKSGKIDASIKLPEINSDKSLAQSKIAVDGIIPVISDVTHEYSEDSLTIKGISEINSIVSISCNTSDSILLVDKESNKLVNEDFAFDYDYSKSRSRPSELDCRLKAIDKAGNENSYTYTTSLVSNVLVEFDYHEKFAYAFLLKISGSSDRDSAVENLSDMLNKNGIYYFAGSEKSKDRYCLPKEKANDFETVFKNFIKDEFKSLSDSFKKSFVQTPYEEDCETWYNNLTRKPIDRTPR